MENISEDIGEEVINQLKKLIEMIEQKLNPPLENGNKQDNQCGLHRIYENPAR